MANAATAYVPLGDSAQVVRYAGDLGPAVDQANSGWSRALIGFDLATGRRTRRDPPGLAPEPSSRRHHRPVTSALAQPQPGWPYSSTFPADPPQDHDSSAGVAHHDQAAFAALTAVQSHWDRPHRRSYHWMVTFDHAPDVTDLAGRCQRHLPTDGLDLVPASSLHLTIRRLGYHDQLTDADITTAIEQAADAVGRQPVFDLQVVPLAGSPGAIRLSVAPWTPLLSLFRAVSVASGQPVDDPGSIHRPHISIAYSNRHQPAQPLIHSTQTAASSEAAVTAPIAKIDLVQMERNDHQYQWRTVTTIPLARTSP